MPTAIAKLAEKPRKDEKDVLRQNNRRSQDMMSMAGWLFADLFLIMSMLFLITQPGQKEVTELTQSPTSLPTATPNLALTVEAAVAATEAAQPTASQTPTWTITPDLRLTGTAQAGQMSTAIAATVTAQPAPPTLGLGREPIVLHLHLDYRWGLAEKDQNSPLYRQVFDALRASTNLYRDKTTGMILLYSVRRSNAAIAYDDAVDFARLLQSEAVDLVDDGVIKPFGFSGSRFRADGPLIEVDPSQASFSVSQDIRQFDVDDLDIILEIYLVVDSN